MASGNNTQEMTCHEQAHCKATKALAANQGTAHMPGYPGDPVTALPQVLPSLDMHVAKFNLTYS